MNILLPIDFSENAKNAAIYALHFFQDIPCTFHILHALPISENSKRTDDLQLPKEFYAEFEVFLAFLNSQKENTDHELKFVFKAAYLVDAVRTLVLEKNIDMIIMGTKGGADEESNFIGKNTSEVMKKVKCPVLAISDQVIFQKCKEICFPTDYKIHYNEEMIGVLRKMLSWSNASVKVLEIFNSVCEPTESQQESKKELQKFFAPDTPVFQSFFPNKNFEDHPKIVNANQGYIIAIAAKNLDICQKFFNDNEIRQNLCANQLPLLILH